MLQITHTNPLVQQLTSKIAGQDFHWFIDLSEVLAMQSNEALGDLVKETAGYTELHLASLSSTLKSLLLGGSMPDNTHLMDVHLPAEEFALKIAVLLTPVAVAHHEKSLGTQGEYMDDGEVYTEKDLFESVTRDVHYLLGDLLPEKDSLEIVRACFLIVSYGRRHKVRLPSGEDFRWMHDHALEIVPVAESVFNEGVFDRERAELTLQAEPPLRDGVL